jgi:hemerythrin
MPSHNDSSPWLLEWSDDLSVSIPEIDAEHQLFIQHVNQLNAAISQRMDMHEIKKCMQTILDDAVSHFAHEEALFKKWNYPDAQAHAKIHRQITLALKAIMAGFTRSGLEYVLIESGLAVKKTLLNHLLVDDMKYRDYCRKNN